MRRYCRCLMVFVSFLLTALSAREAAAVHYKICFRLAVAPNDAGVGEDYGTASTSYWIARGIKVHIEDGDTGADLFGGYNSGNYVRKTDGCVEYDTILTGPIDVTVFAETRIDYSEYIDITAWDHKSQYDAWVAGGEEDNDLQSWGFDDYPVTTCAAGKCATIDTTSQTDPVSNMLAFATWQVNRTEDLSSPKLSVSGSPRLHLINDECPSTDPPTGSCQHEDIVWIESPGQRRKFLVGHEVGHWLHYYWLDRGLLYAGLSGPCSVGSVNSNNPWNARTLSQGTIGQHSHMMRSVEWQACAFIEGFAHFLATVAYNEVSEGNAWFKYYKLWTTPEPDYNYDTVDVEANQVNPPGGPNDYLHSSSGAECPATNAANCGRFGVEMDWLRHYWDFKTDGPDPSLYDIFVQVADAYAAGGGEYDRDYVHDQLEDELAGGILTHWDQSADYNGADAEPE